MLKSEKLSLRPAWATLSKIKEFGSLRGRGALIERKVSLAGHPYEISYQLFNSTSPLPRPKVKVQALVTMSIPN
jgi:hypothetical protein